MTLHPNLVFGKSIGMIAPWSLRTLPKNRNSTEYSVRSVNRSTEELVPVRNSLASLPVLLYCANPFGFLGLRTLPSASSSEGSTIRKLLYGVC